MIPFKSSDVAYDPFKQQNDPFNSSVMFDTIPLILA